jgi:hypothetical protein
MAKWEESVTRCGGVMMSARGEVIPGRGMGGYNVSWADMNLIRQKMKKIHAVDSGGINGQ